MTVRAGIAGWPIAQSLSPALHRAWISAAGLDAAYDAYPCENEASFRRLIGRGRAGELRGLNVTAPWKGLALALADIVSPVAEAAGSANLLVFEDGAVYADSTDGRGLLDALAEQGPCLALTGASVVVLGAGGAARAAIQALVEAGALVTVLNRSRDKAERLAADLGAKTGDAEALADARLVVNALSVAPDIDISVLPESAVVMDMTYRPLETPFLAAARARGLTGVDGMAMLIGQARPSFRALFGVEPPPVDVRAHLIREMALRERAA